MLFDLRGRGRRRAVQAIYLSLAILMGGGLVLFGIGGATSGGLLDAFTSNSGNADVSDVFKKRVSEAETGVKRRPNDPEAWAKLTRVRFQQANGGYDPNKGTFNANGVVELRRADRAYNQYLKLAGDKIDPSLAGLMVNVYGRGALNQPDKAVTAMETVVEKRKPTKELYVNLAALAYQAGQTRKAELASQRALALTPKNEKADIRDALASARAQASASLSGDSGTQTDPSSPNVFGGG